MADLKTTYLGLKLENPVIVSSSALTGSVEKIVKLEDSGAGAVVLKSIFEEQFNYETSDLLKHNVYPEAGDYILNYAKSNAIESYFDLIGNAKARVKLPVIASINCFSSKGWTDFSVQIEKAGASALEVNIFFMPVDMHQTGAQAEALYFRIIEDLKKKISIPISVKIGFRFTNLLNVAWQMTNYGANGLVLFNRFYEPDFDIQNLNIIPAAVLSSQIERRYVLRWIGMVSALNIELDISASTGVHSGDDVIRYILAGANTVQVCSALYKKGFSVISEMNESLRKWMNDKEFSRIKDFRGMLNYKNIENPALFERSQFMKHYSSYI